MASKTIVNNIPEITRSDVKQRCRDNNGPDWWRVDKDINMNNARNELLQEKLLHETVKLKPTISKPCKSIDYKALYEALLETSKEEKKENQKVVNFLNTSLDDHTRMCVHLDTMVHQLSDEKILLEKQNRKSVYESEFLYRDIEEIQKRCVKYKRLLKKEKKMKKEEQDYFLDYRNEYEFFYDELEKKYTKTELLLANEIAKINSNIYEEKTIFKSLGPITALRKSRKYSVMTLFGILVFMLDTGILFVYHPQIFPVELHNKSIEWKNKTTF